MTKRKHSAIIEERRRSTAGLLLSGASVREIAKALGCGLATIQRDIDALRSEWREERVSDITEHVDLDLRRIERMIRALWPACVAGDREDIRTVVRLLDRRAKLLGLDAPARHEHSGPNGKPLEFDIRKLSREELDFAAQIAEKLAGAGGDPGGEG